MTAISQEFSITVPAGTAIATPQVTQLAMQAGGQLTAMRVRVPPGPRGEVGFAITSNGAHRIPYLAGWIIADDEALVWHLDNEDAGQQWELTAYNTGLFAHTLYVIAYMEVGTVVTVPQPGSTLVGTTVT